jgi:hypothetical protein
MRKSWIALAIIALAVGVTAGYRLGRPGQAHRGSQPADRSHETPERESEAAGPPGVPESRPEKDAQRPGIESDEAASPRGDSAAPTNFTGGPTLSPRPSHDERIAPTKIPAAPTQPNAIPPAATTPATTSATTPASSIGPTTSTPPPLNEPTEPAKEAAKTGEADDPDSDRRAPTLQFLRFDPPETKGGGTAILTVGSVDDLSGVKLVYGSVRSPSGSASVPFAARDATGNGEFVATIAVPAQAETGDWYVAALQIVDKADNSLAVAFVRATVPAGGALRVASDDSDSTAPVVHRVSVARGVVDAGDKNQIVVDVDDDRSGVALVTGAFQSPSKAAFIPFTCTPNGEASWVGDVSVPANADCGEWTLRQLRVVDKANNSAFLAMDSPQIGHVGFTVSGGGQCDSDPPVIDGMSFAPAIVSNAEAATIVVTVTAHDDASGVASVSGWIEGPVATNGQAPRINFSCTPDPRDPEAPMTARVTVAQYAAKGVWRVSVAQVADKAGNTRSYNASDPVLGDAIFNVE